MKTKELSYLQVEAYQKYWSLWLFCGGDIGILTQYTKDGIQNVRSDSVITIQRFGLLLIWFGQFTSFLNELFNACQRGIIYDDSNTSATVVSMLQSVPINDNQCCKDIWLIRCSPKRDTPFVISFAKPSSDNKNVEIAHQRIIFNTSTRKYLFQNIQTKKLLTCDSINYLTDMIKREYKYGEGVMNSKLKIITNNNDNTNFNLYV